MRGLAGPHKECIAFDRWNIGGDNNFNIYLLETSAEGLPQIEVGGCEIVSSKGPVTLASTKCFLTRKCLRKVKAANFAGNSRMK